jgi:signal transduction histidine kinase
MRARADETGTGAPSDRILMTATRPRGTTRRLRLGLGLAVAAALPFAPGVTRAEGLTLSGAAIAYVVGSALFEAIAVRRRRFPARVLTPLLGLAVIEVVIVAIPRALGAGLVLFVLGVTFTTYVDGLRVGLWLSGGAVIGATVADVLAPQADRVDAATLAVFAVLVPVLAVITDRLTAERRRTAGALSRLHDVLGAVEAQPDLTATLDSIATSIGQAVGATVTGVVLRDGDRLAVAAHTSVPSSLTPGEVERLTRAELDLRSRSAVAAGLLDRRSLVVGDLDADPRFGDSSSPWASALRGLGCRSLVLAPMRLGRDLIGAVASAFTTPGAPPDEDLAFLEAYAERASTIVVRARTYDRERAAAVQLAETAEQKSEFLALVSHELRTPLTAVKGFVDTVLLHWEQLPEERRRQLLDRASTNADELNRLVGQLLDFSRLDAARVRVSPQPIVLSDVVARALHDLGPALADHRVEVDVREGLAVLADADALGRVLTNLLTNAAKFSPPGSPITVRAEATGNTVVVSVTDHGTGIPADEQELIFDRFYQSPSNVLSRRGTGIGLTIAKRFTEAQGGRIRVESDPGAGSTFFVTVPAPQARAAHAQREGVAT